MSEADDLARLLVPPPGEDVIIRDAVIREWDPDTFENVVEYEGIRLRNVDVGAGAAAEAQSYQPGETIQLELRFASGKRGELGIGDVQIKGRRITPGTDAARQAIAWMQSTLARQLAAQIFADRIHANVVNDFVSADDSDSQWVDLPGSPGPEVSDVEISETGVALVLHGCDIELELDSNNSLSRGMMSFQVTGATSLPPGTGDVRIATLGNFTSGLGSIALFPNVNSMTASWLTGLNAGAHTFTAKYFTVNSGAGAGVSVNYQRRFLVVVAF